MHCATGRGFLEHLERRTESFQLSKPKKKKKSEQKGRSVAAACVLFQVGVTRIPVCKSKIS